MARRTLNTNARIKLAMRENERRVLAHVRQNGSVGGGPLPSSHSWRHAIERLEAKGKLRWSRRVSAYVAL